MRSTQWEYRTVHIDVAGWAGPKIKAGEIETAFNLQGEDGWELVNVLDVNTMQGTTSALLALFKRPR